MKKLVLPVLLIFFAFPAFSQEDEYARFQGVWYGEREDENPYFVFENNTAIFTSNEIDVGTVNFCNFTLSTHKIIFYTKRIFWFSDSEWQTTTPDDEGIDGIFEMDYTFLGNKLILTSDGDSLVLQKMD